MNKHRAVVLFKTSNPFSGDANDGKFGWSEIEDAPVGGYGKKPTKKWGSHKYLVAVSATNGATHQLYLDDPKIIVGGQVEALENVIEAKANLEEALGNLNEAIHELQ